MNRTAKLVLGLGAAGGALVGLAHLAGGSRRRPAAGPFVVLGDSIGEGVAQALEAMGAQVYERARSGAGTPETSGGLETNLSDLPPGTVAVLSTGTNSLTSVPTTELVDQIVDIIRRTRAAGFRVLVMTPPPLWWDDADSEQRAQQEAADRLTIALRAMRDVVDLQVLLGDDEGFWLPELRTPGGIHPTTEGYRVIARSILAGEAG
jgi:lysophospholipase L1-like esterase